MHIRGQIIENPIPLDGCSAYLVKETGKALSCVCIWYSIS